MISWTLESPPLTFILDALWETIRGAGIVDFFDVAVVSFLIYIALRWIHQARAMRVLQGILTISLLYLAARQTGLALTTSMFRGILTLAMLSIVSLFQEDLRHFFERITLYRHDPIHQKTFHALLRSVRHFAKRRIGALIVLKGRDPMDRHLEGGQLLNGRVSSALLESLFDPHSDGHDGAVVIEGDHVTRFGVHLPLSRHLEPESGLGTRHAAALGLSETTDALCVVVSETRGTVMVAREGHLVNLGIGHRLEMRFSNFLKECAQRTAADRPWHLAWDHPVEKGLSILLGFALWLTFVKGIHPAEHVLNLPVQVAQVPRGLQVESINPPQASVTIHGLERDLRALPSDLSILLEVPRITSKLQHLTLASRLVKLPAHVSVAAVSPGSVILRLKSRSSKITVNVPIAKHSAWFKFR